MIERNLISDPSYYFQSEFPEQELKIEVSGRAAAMMDLPSQIDELEATPRSLRLK